MRQGTLEKVLLRYKQMKEQKFRKEAQLIQDAYVMFKDCMEISHALNWKVRQQQEKQVQGMRLLKEQVGDFIEALEIIKTSKGKEEYNLFGEGRVSREELELKFHKTQCSLKISD
mmetsp:Transcript_430/g.476  ORF Transcript_430/g.476 Transcript_430/m.476 type:complete len:115 (-) Transcript_430:754-1098(-)